jgi:hypothetical protein
VIGCRPGDEEVVQGDAGVAVKFEAVGRGDNDVAILVREEWSARKHQGQNE